MIAPLALILAIVVWTAWWSLLLYSTRPVPSIPWASEVAYREKRQCSTGCYSGWEGPPERCAYPQDHYGDCRP